MRCYLIIGDVTYNSSLEKGLLKKKDPIWDQLRNERTIFFPKLS